MARYAPTSLVWSGDLPRRRKGRNGATAPSSRDAGSDESDRGMYAHRRTNMAWREVKRGRRINGTVEKKWKVFTSGGELISVVTYTKREVVDLFPDATIKKDCIYL